MFGDLADTYMESFHVHSLSSRSISLFSPVYEMATITLVQRRMLLEIRAENDESNQQTAFIH